MSDTQNIFKEIHKLYDKLSQEIATELELSSDHGGITGNYREKIWIKLFRQIIPKKLDFAQGVKIIDEKGHISREVDIAIYDSSYTPYILHYRSLKYIPIEAVAVVIECKSKKPNTKSLKNFVKELDKLTPSRYGVARTIQGYGTGLTIENQISTRPIKILASIDKNEQVSDIFDFCIYVDKNENKNENNRLAVLCKNKCKNLDFWAQKLNGYEQKGVEGLKVSWGPNMEPDDLNLVENAEPDKKKAYVKNKLSDLEIEGNPLLTLNFQLNQLLMLINNPMLFPHFAYAHRFQEIVKKSKTEKK